MNSLPNNLVTMAELRNDGNLISPEVMLLESAQDIRTDSMTIRPNKALAIFLQDDGEPGGVYDFRLNQAGMKCSEMLALLDLVAHQVRNMMRGA